VKVIRLISDLLRIFIAAYAPPTNTQKSLHRRLLLNTSLQQLLLLTSLQQLLLLTSLQQLLLITSLQQLLLITSLQQLLLILTSLHRLLILTPAVRLGMFLELAWGSVTPNILNWVNL
jgi:hypothetical protein